MPITKHLPLLFSFLLVAIGCGEINSKSEENPHPIVVSGLVHFEDNQLENAKVRVVAEFGDEYREFVSTTNKDGYFAIELPEPGIYTLVLSTHMLEGIMTSVYEKVEINTDQHFENIEMQYFEIPPEEDHNVSSVEKSSLWDERCFEAGCSSRCRGGWRRMCCGVNLCFTGWEKCIPYERC